jgi:hypothetical protein
VLADAKTHKAVERITASREHPFYVQGQGFVPAGRLAVGNAIVARAGPALVVGCVNGDYARNPALHGLKSLRYSCSAAKEPTSMRHPIP